MTQSPKNQMRSRQHLNVLVASAKTLVSIWEQERRYYLRQISLDPHLRNIALPYAERRLAAVERKITRLQAAIDAYAPRGGTPPPSSRA